MSPQTSRRRRPQSLAVSVCLLLVLRLAVPDTLYAADFATASAKAHGWLVSQMAATGLVDSYKDRKDVCYTYDQAIATLAFVARGDQPRAQRVLEALVSIQNPDGSWNSAYACKTKASLSGARYVGANAWVVLGMAHYERTFGDSAYRIAALRALNWMVDFLQADGGINGGFRADGALITWASTEHNEDAYPALRYFGYESEAALVRGFLENVVFDAARHRWFQGRDDPYDPLDVNPLGVCALGPDGVHTYSQALDFALANHRNQQTWKAGKTRISVDGFDFETDRNDVWLEGTAQMAVALRVAGRASLADHFAYQVVSIQQKSGGIPYSVNGSFSGGFQMSKDEAVASTGWLVIALAGMNPLSLD